MIDPDLLKILCCPETHQELTVADAAALAALNDKIAAGTLRNRGGQIVKDKLQAGLLRADHKYLYPVSHDVPIMLVDEAIPL